MPSVPHSLELVPDAGLEAQVVAVWELLAVAGLPSQARHPHPTNRPHLTLAVADRLDEQLRAALTRELAGLPVPLRLGGLVVLGGRRRTVAWLVVPAASLLELHRRVHAVLGDAASSSPLLRPDRWVPHVTLAARTTPEQAGAVVAALGASESLEAVPALSGTDGNADRARSYDTLARTTTPLHPADHRWLA
jgi:2'-5' RNA ligase